jgi:predicted RNA polymerase sigma factor
MTSWPPLAVWRAAVVQLNRAVAVADAGRPEQALDLDGDQYLHSTRGELLRRLAGPSKPARRMSVR